MTKQHDYRVKQEDREQQLLEKFKKGAQQMRGETRPDRDQNEIILAAEE